MAQQGQALARHLRDQADVRMHQVIHRIHITRRHRLTKSRVRGGQDRVVLGQCLQPRHVAATAQYEKSLQSFTGRVPVTGNYSNSAHAWARCLRHEKELLITAAGLVLPCPWFNSGYQQNSFVQKHSERLNVKTRSLHNVLTDTIWQELWDSFDSDPLAICKIKCKDCK